MNKSLLALALAAALLGAGCATPMAPASAPALLPDHAARVEAVRETETAFAKSMADRDFAAFMAHVSDEAVFANGGRPLVGKAAVGAFWKRFYERPEAPFSWKPEHVHVLASGTLAETEGPVADPSGKVFARFRSTWRLDPDGRWRIVFDNGHPVCNCEAKPPG